MLPLATLPGRNGPPDGPKRVEVFSGPFGGIIEGDSVTLTCSSEANPPVENYTWFKRSGTADLKIGTGQNYTIEHISIEDSYKYKCEASNTHGSAFSEYTPLDILYSPKNTSTYNITTKEDIAPFYCKARNRIGHHTAHPVTCIEVCPKGKVAAAGIGGFCGGLAAAILLNILWIR
ncbi:hypothetical protein MHYP_G00306440 [Metynnis hypsauchen]